jgi:hypothetical protein
MIWTNRLKNDMPEIKKRLKYASLMDEAELRHFLDTEEDGTRKSLEMPYGLRLAPDVNDRYVTLRGLDFFTGNEPLWNFPGLILGGELEVVKPLSPSGRYGLVTFHCSFDMNTDAPFFRGLRGLEEYTERNGGHFDPSFFNQLYDKVSLVLNEEAFEIERKVSYILQCGFLPSLGKASPIFYGNGEVSLTYSIYRSRAGIWIQHFAV